MKPQIKYIELKSGYSDNGPAWIGLVSFSKTGRTIYFNGLALKSLNGDGISGNYFNLETGDEYWVSGVKKDMTDRHWAGGGIIYVEKRIVEDYLKIVGKQELDKRKYEIVEIELTDAQSQFIEIENQIAEEELFSSDLHFKSPKELTVPELRHVIDELIKNEENSKYNKGRRLWKRHKLMFEQELEKRLEE